MATLPGRIRRVSLDGGNPLNYTLQATTSYDPDFPADGPSDWVDPTSMDQDLSLAAPTAVAGFYGCLVTFNRFPEYFDGVVVKIKPTYDTDLGEDPYLEFWTYDGDWTKRRSIQLRNGFVGCPTGKKRYFDFRTVVGIPNVTKFWVTLNPGEGGATVDWYCLHAFGTCKNVPTTPGNCKDDPTIDCIPDDECILDPVSCLTPPITCDDLAPEICNIPPFDWPTLPPPNGGPPPRWLPPEFPLVDLCDPVAVANYKAILTDEQLAYFEELLGAMELPCVDPDTKQPVEVGPLNVGNIDTNDPWVPLLPKQPIEIYYDPETITPATDPRDPDQIDVGRRLGQIEYIVFFFAGAAPGWPGVQPGGTFRAWWVAHVPGTNFEDETNATYAIASDPLSIFGDVLETTDGITYNGIRLTFTGAIAGTVVNVRGLSYGVSGSLSGSPIPNYISDQHAMDGDRPPGSVLTINTSNGIFGTQNPVSGANYFKLNRTGIGEVNFLELAVNFRNFGGTGSGLNWGSGIMLRVIATPPSGTVGVVPSFVVI